MQISLALIFVKMGNRNFWTCWHSLLSLYKREKGRCHACDEWTHKHTDMWKRSSILRNMIKWWSIIPTLSVLVSFLSNTLTGTRLVFTSSTLEKMSIWKSANNSKSLRLGLINAFFKSVNTKRSNIHGFKYFFHGAGFDIFAFFLHRLVRLLQLLIHPLNLVGKRLRLGENVCKLQCNKNMLKLKV